MISFAICYIDQTIYRKCHDGISHTEGVILTVLIQMIPIITTAIMHRLAR